MLALHIGCYYDITEFGCGLKAGNRGVSLGEFFAAIGCIRVFPCRRCNNPFGPRVAQYRDETCPLTRHVLGLEHDHVEFRASEPTPVTETGYRSQFLPHDPDVDLDDMKAQVIAWLDEKSTDKDWLDYQQSLRQGDLFDL